MMNECTYHACRHEGVRKCEFCHELFCKEHKSPMPPGMPRYGSNTREDKAFMELWKKKNHPCPPYSLVWKQSSPVNLASSPSKRIPDKASIRKINYLDSDLLHGNITWILGIIAILISMWMLIIYLL